MDSQRHNRMRMDVEPPDRLSSLPDDLIFKILSFIGSKDVIELSVLSSRWRYMWTSMPYLSFSSEEFSALPKFSKFVTHFLNHRNHQVDLSSVSVNIRGKFGQRIVNKILNYVFAHSVQQLNITCLLEKKIEFPVNSRSLKHLTLIGSTKGYSIRPGSTWQLPALTTLYLESVTLADRKCLKLLFNCMNMKSLTLKNCSIITSDRFVIDHPKLSNLKLENGNWHSKAVDVVAPQLKNLIIINCYGEHLISAPELTSLLYKSDRSLPVIPDSLPTLEKVSLCISDPDESGAGKIVDLLQQFKNVKLLTLSLEIIELLSSSVELISHQPSPFANLTSLKIYPEILSEEAPEGVNMSTEVKNYLLDSSPKAILISISREDVRAEGAARLAQIFMAELRAILNQVEALTESLEIEMCEQAMAMSENQMTQPATKMPINVCRQLTSARSHWEDLSDQVQIGRTQTCVIMSFLQGIEGLLTKLPASKKDKLEACFSSLCIQANTVMNKVIDRLKIQWDMKESRLRECLFLGLSPPAQPSS